MVNVLPEPVWPYISTVPGVLVVAACRTSGATSAAYTVSELAASSKTRSKLKVVWLMIRLRQSGRKRQSCTKIERPASHDSTSNSPALTSCEKMGRRRMQTRTDAELPFPGLPTSSASAKSDGCNGPSTLAR
jgi:hypothetical protein